MNQFEPEWRGSEVVLTEQENLLERWAFRWGYVHGSIDQLYETTGMRAGQKDIEDFMKQAKVKWPDAKP